MAADDLLGKVDHPHCRYFLLMDQVFCCLPCGLHFGEQVDQREMFEGLQVMEAAALGAMNKNG